MKLLFRTEANLCYGGWLHSLQLLVPSINEKKKAQKSQQPPIFMAEPMRASNSFVGTEEYIAPVGCLWTYYFLSSKLFIDTNWHKHKNGAIFLFQNYTNDASFKEIKKKNKQVMLVWYEKKSCQLSISQLDRYQFNMTLTH